MTKRINATVPDELYNWTAKQNRGNKSYVVKVALEIAQLFNGNLAEAQAAREALDEKRGANNDI